MKTNIWYIDVKKFSQKERKRKMYLKVNLCQFSLYRQFSSFSPNSVMGYERIISDLNRKIIGGYKFLKKVKKDSAISTRNLVLDMETYIGENNKLVPYAIGFSTNMCLEKLMSNFSSLISTTYQEESNKTMIICEPKGSVDYQDWLGPILVNLLLIKENHRHVVWAHNGGKFDTLFLLNTLVSLGYADNDGIKIIRSNGCFISIKIFYVVEGRKYWIELRDSYKLIPASLAALSKEFKVHQKGELDFKTINEDNYKEKWNEISTYLLSDLRSLSEVLLAFQTKLFDFVGVDPLKLLSASQIAFKTFRSRYYEFDFKTRMPITIPNYDIDSFFRKAYYGGHVDVYKPHVKYGYYYDINSLYPYAMVQDIPVGDMKYEENLSKRSIDELFGFFRAEIEIKESLHIPFLPVKTDAGLIFPVGKWTGIYFSEELKYAKTLGYKIRLIDGYSFEKSQPFEEYVKTLYKEKEEAGKRGDKALRNIIKLLLNSLYGKFGQKADLNQSKFISDNKKILEIYSKYSNVENTPLELKNNHYIELVTYNKLPNSRKMLDKMEYGQLEKEYIEFMDRSNSSVPIAAAVTAYSRIRIDKFKRILGNAVIYSDTDSIVSEKPLPKNYINDNLGFMKNEMAGNGYKVDEDKDWYFDEGIFLAPKTYMIKKKDGSFLTKFKGISLSKSEIYDTEDYQPLKEQIPLLWKKFKEQLDYTSNEEGLKFQTPRLIKYIGYLSISENLRPSAIKFAFNKRIKEYDRNGVWYSTKPLHWDKETEIESNPEEIRNKKVSYSERKTPFIMLPYPELTFNENFNKYNSVNKLTQKATYLESCDIATALSKELKNSTIFKWTVTLVTRFSEETRTVSSLSNGNADYAVKVFKECVAPRYDIYWSDYFQGEFLLTLHVLKDKTSKTTDHEDVLDELNKNTAEPASKFDKEINFSIESIPNIDESYTAFIVTPSKWWDIWFRFWNKIYKWFT